MKNVRHCRRVSKIFQSFRILILESIRASLQQSTIVSEIISSAWIIKVIWSKKAEQTVHIINYNIYLCQLIRKQVSSEVKGSLGQYIDIESCDGTEEKLDCTKLDKCRELVHGVKFHFIIFKISLKHENAAITSKFIYWQPKVYENKFTLFAFLEYFIKCFLLLLSAPCLFLLLSASLVLLSRVFFTVVNNFQQKK